ncbi:MAG: hypothetical protein P0S95_02335 [Rhabdochlamydiaceae bacterium]|nr:hypothetical protein [Candidatus Amphrikana amoebophyrae]
MMMIANSACKASRNAFNSVMSATLTRAMKGAAIGAVSCAIFGGPIGALFGALGGSLLNSVGILDILNKAGDKLTNLATKTDGVVMRFFANTAARAIQCATLGAVSGSLGGIPGIVLGALGGLVAGALYGATEKVSGPVVKKMGELTRSFTDYLMCVPKTNADTKVLA